MDRPPGLPPGDARPNGNLLSLAAEPKSWKGAIDFTLRGRPAKPRDTGLTMVIDKGMGLEETRALLELAADYIDFIKLAFGTSVFMSPDQLQEKIRLIHAYGVEVYPGGTLLEIAMIQNRLGLFVEQAEAMGFKCLEVSDGTVSMSPQYRSRLIRELVRRGFRVISEVGKKHPADRLPNIRLREQILEDLESGVYKVIVEGRESGKGVVIYHKDGSIDQAELEFLVEAVPDPSVLIWEAPLKEQQQDLIVLFGPGVNLGNVYPHEILSLEAMRNGLRGDTLRSVLLSRPDLRMVRPTWPPVTGAAAPGDDS